LENPKKKNDSPNEDENEKEQFEKEISSKKKIDILKHFREFTNKKRERDEE